MLIPIYQHRIRAFGQQVSSMIAVDFRRIGVRNCMPVREGLIKRAQQGKLVHVLGDFLYGVEMAHGVRLLQDCDGCQPKWTPMPIPG